MLTWRNKGGTADKFWNTKQTNLNELVAEINVFVKSISTAVHLVWCHSPLFNVPETVQVHILFWKSKASSLNLNLFSHRTSVPTSALMSFLSSSQTFYPSCFRSFHPTKTFIRLLVLSLLLLQRSVLQCSRPAEPMNGAFVVCKHSRARGKKKVRSEKGRKAAT